MGLRLDIGFFLGDCRYLEVNCEGILSSIGLNPMIECSAIEGSHGIKKNDLSQSTLQITVEIYYSIVIATIID